MELNRDEIKYIIDLIETSIYKRNESIKKILDHPFTYIDDLEELKRRNAFARGIIAKLQNIK